MIIKIADKMEAISYLHRHGVNCDHLMEVKEFISNKLYTLIREADQVWPQFNWAKSVTDLMKEMK
jgi:hypothetical protein